MGSKLATGDNDDDDNDHDDDNGDDVDDYAENIFNDYSHENVYIDDTNDDDDAGADVSDRGPPGAGGQRGAGGDQRVEE